MSPIPSHDEPASGWFRKFYLKVYEAYVFTTVIASLAFGVRAAYSFVLGLDRWLAGARIPSTGFQVGSPTEKLFWFSVAGIVGSAVAGILVLMIIGGVTHYLWKRPRSRPHFLENLKDAVVEAYDQRRFADLEVVQGALRASVVLFILTAALASLLRRHADSVNSLPIVAFCNALHIAVSLGYLSVMALVYYTHRRELKQAVHGVSDQLDGLISTCIWRTAKWDLWYITIIWLTTILPRRPIRIISHASASP